MTVTTTLDRQYFNCDGANVNFPFNFRFLDNGDIYVWLVAPDGTATQQMLATNYTLTGALEPNGGQVTMLIAPPLTVPATRVLIQRIVPQTQPTSIRNQGRYFPEVHENVFDRLTMLIQQALSNDERSLQLNIAGTAWDFEGKKGINAANPTSPQDVATMLWAQQYIGSILSTGQGPVNNAANVVYVFPDGVPRVVQDLSNKVDPVKGAAGIGYYGRDLSAAIRGLGISPEDYGATNDFGATDSTAAVMAAFNAAKSLKRPLILSGNYGVTMLDFNAPAGLEIIAGGTLTGIGTGADNAREAVLILRNFNDFKMYGRLVVSGGYKTHYKAAVAIYSDSGVGASQFNISGLTTVAAQVGVRIGRRTEQDALISEATFFGGESYGCPTVFEIIGTQTVINLIGVNAISSQGVPPGGVAAAWAALPRCAIRTYGASVRMEGGEALITDVTTGLLFDNRPIASALVGNRYGKIDICATIESASPVCKFWNPEGIGSLTTGTGSVTLRNCDGFHSQNTVALIECADDFPGKIIATNNTMFYPGTRTVANIAVGAAPCDIVADENSFGQGFMKGFDSITGGRLSFGYQKIVEVNSLNQTIPAGPSTSDLVFKVKPTNPGNNRFGGPYSTTTGVYTVPSGGLKSVHVTVNMDQLAARPNSLIALVVNGIALHYAGANADRYLNASWDIGDLTSGSTIKLQYTAGSGTSSFNFTTNTQDRMIISARY